MGSDIDRLHEDWNEQADPERAVTSARSFMEGVRDRLIDPVPRLDQLELAADPLWDGPGGDPALVLEAVGAAQPAFRHAERFGGLKDPARLYLRGRPWNLLARSEHRAGRERDAFLSSLGLATWLQEDVVGGRHALRTVLGHPTPNPVAELTVAALGLYPAALRRAGLPRPVREQYVKHGRELVEAYVPDPVIYDRSAALASTRAGRRHVHCATWSWRATKATGLPPNATAGQRSPTSTGTDSFATSVWSS